MKSRYKIAKRVLIFWTIFIGIGAVAGAVGMFSDTSGAAMKMDAMLPYFQKLPFAEYVFQDFLFPGIALLIVNGLTNLTAAVLLFMNKKIGIYLGGIFGVTLMLWICIQFYIFPFNFMSTSFFIFGFLQAVTGYITLVFYKQETYFVNEKCYSNIGTNHKRLVVYFSRMGYVKEKAFEEADRTGAEIYEVRSTELTEGTKGFWWCGRYGMHRWEMPIETINTNLSSYDHVTICSPIWVFNLCAPIRSFCKQASGQIKEVDYILVHHNKSDYVNAADEMDSLLDIKHVGLKSFCCREGKFK